jgi:two-component system nitrogen regulation response regulator NtrX
MTHDILIVDDEADIRQLIAGVLRDEGYETREAANSDSALAEINGRAPALLILDIWLQGSKIDGVELLDIVKGNYPELPVVMISGHGTIETAVRTIKNGAYDFIEKPFQSDRLLLVVDRAIEAAQLRREVQDLRLRAGSEAELIGNSGATTQLRMAIDQVAPTTSRVLITGSPGSGKEVVARQIHVLSGRSNGPFVAVNAATMAPERMESELFGVETDSPGFGGSGMIGTFERAHGGTLFLDEVSDMPLETQGKILRFLQEQAFTRVGGARRIQVDVRIIAATNRNLREEISAGRFREGLYYRLNVVPIHVPPLRERREDIPDLAFHFMTRAAEAAGIPPRHIAEDSMAALQTCEWPGNVRQLRNVIEWLLIMAPREPRGPIRADMLPPDLTATTPPVAGADASSEIMALPLRDAREVFERQYLSAQLMRFGGNISRAATFVNMERSALHRKLKSLGIGEDSVRRGASGKRKKSPGRGRRKRDK